MPIKTIISDWNGTILEHPTDEVQNKKIAYAVLDDAKHAILEGKIWRIGDVARLLGAKKELKKRLREYQQGKRQLWEVYEPFNEKVLRGRSVSFLNGMVDEYAKECRDKVDVRVMRPIQAVHNDGTDTSILSVSYDYSIRRILEEAGFPDVFDCVYANELLRLQGDPKRAKGLTLDIYGKKAEFLKELLGAGLSDDRGVLYLGDTTDDEPVAEILPAGHFIVPFFATDDFRQYMASKHKAFVPESEQDLHNYLRLF